MLHFTLHFILKNINILIKLLPKILLSTFLGSVLIIDIPLLFESHLQFMFSSIYVISLEPEEQLKRLKNRNKELKEKECKERIESQMKLTKKISLGERHKKQ